MRPPIVGGSRRPLVLAPLAPLGVALGVWMHNRVTDRFFFQVAYTLLFFVGIRLVREGMSTL